jgi:hypothetical protein
MIFSPLEISRDDTGFERACFSTWCEKVDCSLMIATPILGCSERTFHDCCTSYGWTTRHAMTKNVMRLVVSVPCRDTLLQNDECPGDERRVQ